jgi:hypothetical protein
MTNREVVEKHGRRWVVIGSFDADKARTWHGRPGGALYRTSRRRWVQERRGLCQYVDDEAAAEWLTRNGFTEDAAGVLNPRPAGRPSIGPLVSVRLPEALVDELDELAGEDKKKRADVIRELLEEGVARRATENRTR